MPTPPTDPRDGSSTPPDDAPASGRPPATESCDLCGSESVVWRNCKLVCLSCRAIVRSCADL